MRRTAMAFGAITCMLSLGLGPVVSAGASVTVTEWGTPSAGSYPVGITLGRNADLYFSESSADNIGQLTPSSGIPTFGFEYPLPSGDEPGAMATGRDGNLWFADQLTRSIGRISPDGSGYQEFPITTAQGSPVPGDITAGPDGNLWFTVYEGTPPAYIGRITTAGSMSLFPVPDDDEPVDITTGPDGNLWFTSQGSIWRLTTSGSFTPFSLGGDIEAQSISAGPDGNLWFTEAYPSYSTIGEMTTSGTLVGQFPVPDAYPGVVSQPLWIAEDGCGGDLWTADANGSVGRVTTSGSVTVYPTPSGFTGYQGPTEITWGPGGMWFTDAYSGEIGRVSDTADFLCASLVPVGVWVRAGMKGQMGGTIGWLMNDPKGTHGVADASGLQLFGYGGPAGGPIPEPYGADPSFTYDWAGTFPYDDPFHPHAKGHVAVPMTVAAVPGTTGEAQASWAVADAPAGDVFDVQVEVPGSAQFVDWQTAVPDLSAVFGPSDPLWAGSGKYRFRSSLRQTASGAASAYSPPVSISLHTPPG